MVLQSLIIHVAVIYLWSGIIFIEQAFTSHLVGHLDETD